MTILTLSFSKTLENKDERMKSIEEISLTMDIKFIGRIILFAFNKIIG